MDIDIDAILLMLELSNQDYVTVKGTLYIKSLYCLSDAFNIQKHIINEYGELSYKYIHVLENNDIYFIQSFSIYKEKEPIYCIGSQIQYIYSGNKKIRLGLQDIKMINKPIKTIELYLN